MARRVGAWTHRCNVVPRADPKESHSLMNAQHPTRLRFFLSSAALLVIAPAVLAQSSPSSAAELARYDANRNGRLDPEEIAARDAVTKSGAVDTPIVISP